MNAALIVLGVVGAAVVLVLLWALLTYNRLVGLKAHIRDAWAGVDVELKRRYDLIPNLVETVKGYATHERETLESVVRLRAQAMANTGAVDSQARDERALVAGLRQVQAVIERYPTLQADDQFLSLQRELAETEDRIAAARRFYNGNVRAMNQLVRMVPSNIVASLGGFQEQSYFELDDPAQREAPRVST